MLFLWRSYNMYFRPCCQDGEWGREALFYMIEIYLNPDNRDNFAEHAEAKGTQALHSVALIDCT